MVTLASLLYAALLACSCTVAGSSLSARTSYAVKEVHHLPRAWRPVARAHRDHRVSLKIGLRQRNFQELERRLYEVSDPEHRDYGNHLSAEEVSDLVRPSDEALNHVHEWLEGCGVPKHRLSYSPARDWISISMRVSEAEELLNTKYQVYQHQDGTRLVRTLQWSLPRHLHEHVDAVQPTTSFFRASPQRSFIRHLEAREPDGYTPPADPLIAKVCNVTSVTPECFAHLYGTANYQVKLPGSNSSSTGGNASALGSYQNSVAFNNFLGEIPIRPDTAKFLAKYRPDAEPAATTFPQLSVNGGPTQDGPLTLNQSRHSVGLEADLDVQTLLGIAYPVPVVSYSTGGDPPFQPDAFTPENTNEPYLEWLNYILEQPYIPPVISTSYADNEQTVPFEYAQRVCQQFAVLGARGATMGRIGRCSRPAFPPSCPYVTVVGGTYQFQPEVAAFRPARYVNGTLRSKVFASGGGFGNYFSRPSYQDDVVPDYIEGLNGRFDGLYNKSGRAYPDIAAQSQFFRFVWNGTEALISGTSASTPLVAGIIALVNDALIAGGKKPLGFLNPWLYKKGFEGLNDITNGSAVGCESTGFPAAPGWDPVTGFGTPIFQKLVKLAGGEL